MDGGAWKAAVHGVAEGQARLSDFTFTFHFSLSCIGEGNGNPLQCSCLENLRDGGAWWAAVCGVAQSWTRLKQLSSRRLLATGNDIVGGIKAKMFHFIITLLSSRVAQLNIILFIRIWKIKACFPVS